MAAASAPESSSSARLDAYDTDIFMTENDTDLRTLLLFISIYLHKLTRRTGVVIPLRSS